MLDWWKAYRSIDTHPVWKLPATHFKVWFAILNKANYSEGVWFDGKNRVVVPPGTLVTSQEHLAEYCSLGRQVVRSAIKNLIALESISTNTITNRYSVITVINWESYQCRTLEDNQQVNQSITNRQPTDNHNIRKEEGKKERRVPKTLATVVDQSTPWPTTLEEVRLFLSKIQAPEEFFNQTYWLRIDQWLGGNDSSVFYFEELKAYLAWIAAQNGHRKHKDLLRGFRNWLSTCARWKERDAQRKAVSSRY